MPVAGNRIVQGRRSVERRLEVVGGPGWSPQSVTQRFFEEGERKEATGWSDEQLEYSDYVDSDEVPEVMGPASAVPTVLVQPVKPRRSWLVPMSAVAALALSGVAFGMAWRLHDGGQSRTSVPMAETAPAAQPAPPPPEGLVAAAASASTASPPAAPAPEAAPVPPSTPSTASYDVVPMEKAPAAAASADDARQASGRTVAATVRERSVAASSSRRVAKSSAAVPESFGSVPLPVTAEDAPRAANQQQDSDVSPTTGMAAPQAGKNDAPIIGDEGDAPAAPSEAAVAPPSTPPTHATAEEKEAPLRGVVWSPAQGKLVPAEPASGSSAAGDEAPTPAPAQAAPEPAAATVE